MSHGHIHPSPYKCRCGGPALCEECWKELAALSEQERSQWMKWNEWTEKEYNEAKLRFEDDYPIHRHSE